MRTQRLRSSYTSAPCLLPFLSLAWIFSIALSPQATQAFPQIMLLFVLKDGAPLRVSFQRVLVMKSGHSQCGSVLTFAFLNSGSQIDRRHMKEGGIQNRHGPACFCHHLSCYCDVLSSNSSSLPVFSVHICFCLFIWLGPSTIILIV